MVVTERNVEAIEEANLTQERTAVVEGGAENDGGKPMIVRYGKLSRMHLGWHGLAANTSNGHSVGLG